MNNSKKFWQDLKSGRFVSMVKEASKGEVISNSDELFNIVRPLFADEDDVERLYGIFLDSKNKILSIEKLFSGSICSSAIYPREIVKRMLANKAVGFIMIHNHPSGDCVASSEDYAITAKVCIALASIDATLHEHMIVGDDYYSLADNGLIEKVRTRYHQTVSTNIG